MKDKNRVLVIRLFYTIAFWSFLTTIYERLYVPEWFIAPVTAILGTYFFMKSEDMFKKGKKQKGDDIWSI